LAWPISYGDSAGKVKRNGFGLWMQDFQVYALQSRLDAGFANTQASACHSR
jgi:hypothetical protein